MRYSLLERVKRSRTLSGLAVLAITLSLASSAGVAQARVSAGDVSRTQTMLSVDAVAKATGGGTVLTGGIPNAVASFGLNARRPAGYTGGSGAAGRINYDRHSN